MMPQRKGKKLIIYFFLLLTLASINNIKFPNIGFDYINKINVSGLDICLVRIPHFFIVFRYSVIAHCFFGAFFDYIKEIVSSI